MWQLKIPTILIVVDALGLVRKGTGKQNIAEIQKIVLTSTAYILRKTLSI